MANQPFKFIESRGLKGRTGIMFTWGTSVPSDGETGYGSGCLFAHTDCSDQDDALYCNIGDESACNFNLVTVASD